MASEDDRPTGEDSGDEDSFDARDEVTVTNDDEDDEDTIPVRRFGRRRARWRRTAIAGVFAVAALLSAISSHGPKGPTVTDRIVAFVVFLALSAVAWRIWRSGIVAQANNVVFHNIFRTRAVPWNEIVRFDPPKPWGAMINPGLRAVRANGRVVASSLYTAGPLTLHASAEPVTVRLNQLLKERRTLTAVSADPPGNALRELLGERGPGKKPSRSPDAGASTSASDRGAEPGQPPKTAGETTSAESKPAGGPPRKKRSRHHKKRRH